MTNFLIPYTFVGGTKAKAEEVNANFTAMQEELLTKANLHGASTNTFEVADATSTSHAVNKTQIDTEVSKINATINENFKKCAKNTGFVVNDGNKTNENVPDLLDTLDSTKIIFKVDDGTTYKPLTATLASGEEFELTNLSEFSTNALNNGVNNLFINKNGELAAYTNKIYKQKTQPTVLIETPFTQPVLSSYGTMGGSGFAVSVSSEGDASNYPGWAMFNGNIGSSTIIGNVWLGQNNAQNQSVTFYNPITLKISNLRIVNTSNDRAISSGNVYYSDDGTTYTLCKSFTNSATTALASWNIPITEATSHKYWKLGELYFASGHGGVGIAEMYITANEVVEGVKINDLWVNTSTKPYEVKKFNGTGFDDFDYVPLPQAIMIQSGLITATSVINSFGLNGIDEVIALPNYSKEIILTSGVTFTAPFIGWVRNILTDAMYVIEQGQKTTPTNTYMRYYPIKGV